MENWGLVTYRYATFVNKSNPVLTFMSAAFNLKRVCTIDQPSYFTKDFLSERSDHQCSRISPPMVWRSRHGQLVEYTLVERRIRYLL